MSYVRRGKGSGHSYNYFEAEDGWFFLIEFLGFSCHLPLTDCCRPQQVLQSRAPFPREVKLTQRKYMRMGALELTLAV